MIASDQDPNQQSPPRKLRAFMGFLMNTEEVLLAGGFDLAEAYTYAVGEYDRLEQLEQAAAGLDPSRVQEWRRQEQLIEDGLSQRWKTALAFVQDHAPDHFLLPHYLSYQARWRRDLPASPPRTPTSLARPDPQLQVLGLTMDRLLYLHACLSAMPLPHEFVRSYAIFLSGLHHAVRQQATSIAPLTHPTENQLLEVSRKCVEAAAEFALQAQPQMLARTAARLPADIAFHCLFMGIAYVQGNCADLAGVWLQQGLRQEQENRLCLFFAMGGRSLTMPCAQRLVRPIQQELPRLVSQHLGSELGLCLEQFAAACD
jgi:hypothetical protein